MAGVLEAIPPLAEAAHRTDCPPVPVRQATHTSLPPAPAGLSVPLFLHYCWPRVWTARPLRAQQDHGSEPLDSPGLGY